MRHRVVIEVEALVDDEMLKRYFSDEKVSAIALHAISTMGVAKVADPQIRFKARPVRHEVCTPRRQVLLLQGMGHDPRPIVKDWEELIGGPGLRPSELLESLLSGVTEDAEEANEPADLDFLLGTIQQWDQQILEDLVGSDDLPFHWIDLVGEVKRLIADHGGDCLLDELPSSWGDPPMRTVMMQPFQEGKGPIVTLSVWDAHGTWHGKHRVRYRLSSDGEIIFEEDRFGCSPLHAIDSLECMRAVLGFLTCVPSEMEDDFSEGYLPHQREWAEQYGEDFCVYAMDQDARPFDWDSNKEDDRFITILEPGGDDA